MIINRNRKKGNDFDQDEKTMTMLRSTKKATTMISGSSKNPKEDNDQDHDKESNNHE